MLIADSISFGYDGARPVVSNLTARFSADEIIAITGPSGRGKSTLLYILGLMLRPQQGRVTVGGKDSSRLSDAERAGIRARQFGFIFQDAALDTTRTVLDNILETTVYRGGLRAGELDYAYELMNRFGIELRAAARPGEISGGQAQRVALCRALLSKPEIVLADEPTGNLDRNSANVVIDALIAHARSGACVVIVTHDQHVVERCDRVVEL